MTSWTQAIKLHLVDWTQLSRDALHIHIGMAVYLLLFACFAGRRRWYPLIGVLLIALLGEALDWRDDLITFGRWRWQASLHDVVNTLWWPCVLQVALWVHGQRRD